MSTETHTPANITEALALVKGSHGAQVALIAALLGGFSPETRSRTLGALRAHDLDPVWNFEVIFRLTILNHAGTPAEEEKNYQETYAEEVNAATYDTEEAALEEAMDQALTKFKEDHQDVMRPGWHHTIESAFVRRFDPYALTMTAWGNPPTEYMVRETFTLEGR